MLKLSANTRTRKSSGYKAPGKQGSPLLRTIRNTAVGILILGGIFVGGGVGYIWYMGQKAPVQAVSPAPVSRSTALLRTPPQPRPDARVGASVQSLTTPITPGSNATITIRTNAKAKCTISAEYNNVPSKDSGLLPKTADEYGMVTWSWTVGPTVPIGTWPVKMTCANAKNSAEVNGKLQVVKTLPQETGAAPTAAN